MGRKTQSKDEIIDVTKGMLERQNMALTMDMGALQAEREAEQQLQAQQTEKEQMIAQCFEVIGQIKGVQMLVKFGDVASLVWLKEVKETKIYREVPGIGTWDKFCESIGKSRRQIDEDLLNLQIFGDEFLGYVANLRVGYRELRKLRQLTHDGTVLLEGDTITIGDKTIPVDKDHADDIQEAIEWILTENDQISKRVEKLEKDFTGAVKEETKGLHSEIKTYKERVKQLEQFEPHEHDREWSVKQMEKIEKAAGALQISITAFIIDPRLKDDRHLQAKVSGHLQEAELALQDARTRLDAVIDMFND